MAFQQKRGCLQHFAFWSARMIAMRPFTSRNFPNPLAVQLLIASVLAGSILIISTNRVVAQEDALQEADQLRWPTVEAAREFIEDRERVLFQAPVHEDDWRAKTAMILTFQWDEYEQAYGEALNNRTLAYESLQTAERLLERRDLKAANRHLEMHLYYFEMMLARFEAIGRSLGLAGETLQRYGQASSEVACSSSQFALMLAGQWQLKDMVSFLCIPARFAVDVQLGERVDDAMKDGVTRLATWALWHWAVDHVFNNWQEWERWIGHSSRQGGSGLYQRLTEHVSSEEMHRQIMRLAAGAPDDVVGESLRQAFGDEGYELVDPVIEGMIEYMQPDAVESQTTAASRLKSELVAAIQIRLAGYGYAPGGTDGAWRSDTREALQAWQKSWGRGMLENTEGRVDVTTVFGLILDGGSWSNQAADLDKVVSINTTWDQDRGAPALFVDIGASKCIWKVGVNLVHNGDLSVTGNLYRDGDTCPDKLSGVVEVVVRGERIELKYTFTINGTQRHGVLRRGHG